MNVGLEIKKFKVGEHVIPGRRSILIDGIQCGIARALSQKNVWVIKDLNGNDLDQVVPAGKKSLIDESIRVAASNLRDAGKLKLPKSEPLRAKWLQQQEDEARKAKEAQKVAAVNSLIEALEFIMDHQLLEGPYHLQDKAKRKVRLALEKALA